MTDTKKIDWEKKAQEASIRRLNWTIDWEKKAQEASIRRINWVIANIGKVAELIPLYGESKGRWDPKKLDCFYIDEWDYYCHDAINICFYPVTNTGNSFYIKIHQEDLNKFIKEFLKANGLKIVKDDEEKHAS